MIKNYFIINPKAGKGRGLKTIKVIEKIVPKFVNNFEIYVTKSKQDATFYSNKIRNIGANIMCVGGDGTVNEVINGLGVNSNSTFFLLPIGSGNDFAKELNLSKNIHQNLEKYFLNSQNKLIDIGEFTFESYCSKQSETYFFASSLGIGFDAYVAHLGNQNKILRGFTLYLYSVIRALFSYNSSYSQINFDEIKLFGKKLLISIGNSKTSGGGFYLTPNASNNDGKLDICVADNLSPFKILNVLPKAIFGNHINLKPVLYFKTSTLKIKNHYTSFVHCDGEVITKTLKEIVVKIHKDALKVGY